MTQTATPQTDAPAVPAIFEPIEINGVRVRNRLILPPMCQYSCEARDGVPHGWQFQHLGARAAGGGSGGEPAPRADPARLAAEGEVRPAGAGW